MAQQLDSLIDAVQCAIHGILPINIVNPTTVQNILRNVTLHLPGYEIIVGIRIENLYNELANDSLIANDYGIKLIVCAFKGFKLSL